VTPAATGAGARDRTADPRADRIGIGCATLVRTGVSTDVGAAVIDRALDAGVTSFDTAAFYGGGRAEALLGSCLEGRRERVRLITKGGVSYADISDLTSERRDCSYDALRRDLEGSLARLRTDHVDVYLLHQQDLALSAEAQMANLARLRDEGLARAVGFCNFGPDAFRAALATGIPKYVEYSYSLLDHRYAGELAAAGAHGLTRITFGTFAHGLLAEPLTPDTEFSDWRGRSRRSGDAGTSGNPLFAGDAYRVFLAAADRLRAVASDAGVSLATLVLALTWSADISDVTLAGCRSVEELEESLAALDLVIDDVIATGTSEALAAARPLEGNRLGRPR
jgi:aryl-alcohol dehydrogenase-like predicted oxidoreductase